MRFNNIEPYCDIIIEYDGYQVDHSLVNKIRFTNKNNRVQI